MATQTEIGGKKLDVLTVQVMIVLYSFLAISVVFLLWHNAAAPDALKNTGIAMASILPLLLSVLPYLNTEKLEAKYTYILLYDSTQKQVITGQRPNAYLASYIYMFTNLSALDNELRIDQWTELMGPKGLHIIEKGIIEAMILQFNNQWDIITETSSGPIFDSITATTGQHQKKFSMSPDEVRQKFTHNRSFLNLI